MNRKAAIPERGVLPRLRDVVQMVLVLLPKHPKQGLALLAVTDFGDAFKHLIAHPAERRYMCGVAGKRGKEKPFAYRAVLYGHIAGPLVWARLAAAVFRATASLQGESDGAAQCYVDDPILVVSGTSREQQRRLLKWFLLWRALGLDISWRKAQTGDSVQWIGASISLLYVDGMAYAVEVQVAPDKVEKFAAKVAALLKSTPRVNREELRAFAGLTSWIAGVIPGMRPFSMMIWGAACSPPSTQEIAEEVSVNRVKFPLTWLSELVAKRFVELPRRFLVAPPASAVFIGFDASPTGGGAWISTDARASISHYFAITWTAVHGRLLRAQRGEPGSQALWEGFALLLAVQTWIDILTAHQAELHLFGDALGVLHAVLGKRARSPDLNLLVAELNLELAPSHHEMAATHLWSEEKDIADALSRLEQDAEVPLECKRSIRVKPIQRQSYRFLGGTFDTL